MAKFYVFVNGNRLHDEGEHDEAGKVIRAGGGPLEFSKLADAEKFAQTKYDEHVAAYAGSRRRTLPRDRFVAAAEPPPVPEPAPEPAPEPTESPDDGVEVPPVG